jgi:hypothetical protein
MPFTYLGLPMVTKKPRVEHYAPLMNRVKRQLTSISSMLTHADNLQLVNTVLSYLPTYTMGSIQVLLPVHEYFDRARRQYMCKNSKSNARSKPLVPWRKCMRPKKRRGRGWESLISENRIWACFLILWTSSIIKETTHGLNFYGTYIMPMERSPILVRIEGHFGGGT